MPKQPAAPKKILQISFFQSGNGSEPVRRWLKKLDKEARRGIGEDLKTVQFGWPLGMPLVRSLGGGLWEVRSRIPNGIARVIFVMKRQTMVLLHGFVKKSQKTPSRDLEVARQRAKCL